MCATPQDQRDDIVEAFEALGAASLVGNARPGRKRMQERGVEEESAFKDFLAERRKMDVAADPSDSEDEEGVVGTHVAADARVGVFFGGGKLCSPSSPSSQRRGSHRRIVVLIQQRARPACGQCCTASRAIGGGRRCPCRPPEGSKRGAFQRWHWIHCVQRGWEVS